MLSLDQLKAFSVRKGCYPGQEIVARTHFLGQSKRRLWGLTGQGLSAGQTVCDADGRSLGELIEASPDGCFALTVAALEPGQTVHCGGSEALAAPTGDGLARPD